MREIKFCGWLLSSALIVLGFVWVTQPIPQSVMCPICDQQAKLFSVGDRLGYRCDDGHFVYTNRNTGYVEEAH